WDWERSGYGRSFGAALGGRGKPGILRQPGVRPRDRGLTGRPPATRRSPGLPGQPERRRDVRGDEPKRRAGSPWRAAFAARDGAWLEAAGAPPSHRAALTRHAPSPQAAGLL